MDHAKPHAAPSLEAGLARNDGASAAIITKAITLQQIHGTRQAAEFLREQQVDLDTVRRILLNAPELRRHDDFVIDTVAAAFAGVKAA